MIPHLFHIFPDLAFLVRISKQIGRMKSGHYLYAEIILKMASHFCDTVLGIQQIVKRGVAHHNDNFWPDDRDLAKQKWPTVCASGSVGARLPGRATAVDIADKNVLAFETDALDYFCQKLPGTTNERKALIVLVRSRGFADKHQVRLQISGRVHDLLSARIKLAPRAVADVSPNVLDRLARLRQLGARIESARPRGPIFLRPFPLSPNR